ncbi:YqcI/YcgG family protein [Halorubrum sp. 2020YC2]|nr:YqcI/YcgG family protein [Halorubrum sp. 2020YC2]
MLDFLQKSDPEPWPASVPTDPYHPKWQYCFAGQPVFIVARAPFYEARKSRHTAHGLEITFQPWTNFESLTGLDDKGQEARTLIRRRLSQYDDVDKHPDAGDLDDPRKLEWQDTWYPIITSKV